jgi:LPS-assembly lipoprotein
LQKRVQIRLHDKEGNDWLPADEIVVRRTYLYDDTERLARQIQENRLVKEMQTEAVRQIVRRLQAARNPNP